MDAVSQILVDRSQEADKVSRMVLVSLAAHIVLLGAVTFLPKGANTDANPNVMMIQMSGAPGPEQGRNPISNRRIEEAVPENVKPKDTPPPLAKPEMVEPVKTAPTAPKTPAKPEPKKDTPQLHGRTPTQGAQVREGTAKVETGSQAQQAFGLATAGGQSVGNAAYTDYADFCCPEYLDQMVAMVRRNWTERQGQDGENTAKFTIQRDGTITDVTIEKGSSPLLDLATKRALIQTQRLAPLPAKFSPPQLTVHLVFQYKR